MPLRALWMIRILQKKVSELKKVAISDVVIACLKKIIDPKYDAELMDEPIQIARFKYF